MDGAVLLFAKRGLTDLGNIFPASSFILKI